MINSIFMNLMKNKLVEFLVLFVLFALVYFGGHFLLTKIGVPLGHFYAGFIITLFVISFTYKKWWSGKTLKSLPGIIILSFSFVFLFAGSTYLLNLYERSTKLHSYLNNEKRRGWKGKVHQPDDTLGFKPIPGAKGLSTFPIGESLPIAFDQNGFRVALSDINKKEDETNIDLLFLGCSFTFGDACLAEETFPYLVSKETGMTYINAGVCSYGLSQMLILAEKLIPKYKPKYVIVQHSPWLIKRGINPFAPTYFGSLPNPYFVEEGKGVGLHPPIYLTQMFDLDIETIKKESVLKFFITKGIFYFMKEDWMKNSSKFKTNLGVYKRPINKPLKAEGYAYSKICKIAKENQSKVIILTLYTKDGSSQLKKVLSKQEVLYANADSLLAENLKVSQSKVFNKVYAHWRMRGSDSVIVDGHPNPLAHQIISKSIIPLVKEN
jgi:hypothetical protein